MSTYRPTNYGLMTWDQAEMPLKEFTDRVTKIREAMQEEELDALLIYGDRLHEGNICYVSNVMNGMLILPKDGSPTIIGSFALRGICSGREISWIKDWRCPSVCESMSAYNSMDEGAARVLKHLKLTTGRLGLVGAEDMSALTYNNLRKALPKAEFKDAPAIIEDMRMIKNEKELAVIRKSTNLADSAYEALVAGAKEGRRGYEVAADMDRAARLEGAQETRISMATGSYAEKALMPNLDSARKLERGDMILVSFTSQYSRYWAEIGRTIAISPVSQKQSALFEAAVKAQDKIIKAVKPGVKASDVAKKALQMVDETGYGRHLQKGYGFGNGIGLDIEEKPRLADGDETKLRAGMVLSVRVGLHAPGVGGAFLCDTILVKDGEAERLLKSPYNLEDK